MGAVGFGQEVGGIKILGRPSLYHRVEQARLALPPLRLGRGRQRFVEFGGGGY